MDMNTAHAMPFAQGSASASATSPSCVAPAPARAPGRRNRLRPKAACYLDEFVLKHGLNPTREQRDILVAGVKSFPGHDYYNRHLLERWLYTRRAGIVGGGGSASSKGTAPPGLATTLTSKQISDLRDLVAHTPEISAELLAVWERLFHVQKSVIEAWIRDNPVLPPTPITPTHPAWAPEESLAWGRPVEEWRAGAAHGTHQQRLPTPAETASPDPESPLLLHATIQSSHQSALQLPRCKEISNPSVATSRSEYIRAAILQGIRDGAKVSVHHPPKTMAELDAFWATFEPKLSRVIQTLESIPRP